jgi:hypothetical protein
LPRNEAMIRSLPVIALRPGMVLSSCYSGDDPSDAIATI